MTDFNENRREAIRMMIQSDHLHRSLFDGVMNTFGLHRNQHFALMYLHRHGCIDSQRQIADHLGISPAAIAVMLKKLELRGYVARRVSDSDNRNHTIVITDAGKEILEKTRCSFMDIDCRMLRGLSEQELDVFITCYQKIQANLQSMRIEGGKQNEMVEIR